MFGSIFGGGFFAEIWRIITAPGAAEPRIIRLVGEYEPILGLVGEYEPVLAMTGEYQPVVSMVGEVE